MKNYKVSIFLKIQYNKYLISRIKFVNKEFSRYIEILFYQKFHWVEIETGRKCGLWRNHGGESIDAMLDLARSFSRKLHQSSGYGHKSVDR